ncbi:hypothetical protein ACFX59_17040 [Sphingomonas sp. NCPPB 2930]|uniref:hypothetical protein n=1 Tax=Sphingomonas sp. NCPPB 2930 TaxID=3162788 RepID=UPI0036D86CE4
MKNEDERSALIVAEAKRIIELTVEMNVRRKALDDLDLRRKETGISLARLVGADIGEGVPYGRLPINTALAIIAQAGDDGISASDLATEVDKTTGISVTAGKMEAALSAFLTAGDIRLSAGIYRPGLGRPNRRQGKAAIGAPTDRHMVLEVLRSSPVPLGVSSIVKAIEERFHLKVPRTVVSPLLAKMRDRGGAVIHVGQQWTVPKEGMES